MSSPLAGSLTGRHVVVTGAGSGIGLATSRLLAAHCCKVVLTDRNAAGGQQAVHDIKQEFPNTPAPCFLQAELTDPESLKTLFQEAQRHLDGHLDALVNCAGVNHATPRLHEMPSELLDSTLDVNVKGTWRICQLFISAVLEQDEGKKPKGGYSIVNTGSVSSVRGSAYLSAYCTSKHAILGFTRTLAQEYAAQGIRTNMVAPGVVETPLATKLFQQLGLTYEAVIKETPLARAAQPAEVAEAIAFLIGPGASYITGAIIPVDGGWTA